MSAAPTDAALTEPTDRSVTYTIAEASQRTGVSTDTLRYYERAGVMPDVARTAQGHRAFTDDDLGWIAFVRRLRATGMPMLAWPTTRAWSVAATAA